MANSKRDGVHVSSESGYDFVDKSDGQTSGESDSLDGSPGNELTENVGGTGTAKGGTSGGRGGGAQGAGASSESEGSHGGE